GAQYPGAGLGVGVVVAKAKVRRRSLQRPGLVVASVEPNHGQLRRGHVENGRHARLVALWNIDGDVRNVPRMQEGARAFEVPRIQPFGLAKLDGDLKPKHALLALFDIREGRRGREEPGRELKEHGSELARRAKRLEGLAKPLP